MPKRSGGWWWHAVGCVLALAITATRAGAQAPATPSGPVSADASEPDATPVPSDLATAEWGAEGTDEDAQESAVPSDLANAQWGVLDDAEAVAPAPAEPSAEPEAADEITLNARIMAGFQLRSRRQAEPAPMGLTRLGARETDYGFVLRQARVRMQWQPNKRLRMVLSADFADALDPTDFSPPPYLRNAYLQLAIERRWLELRVGRFKRPYSRLELRSAGVLPVIGRGLGNGLIVGGDQWGERAVGAMFRGRVDPARLRWWLGAFDPDWSASTQKQGMDLLGRLQWEPIEGLQLGAGGGTKLTEDALGERIGVWALGVDARLRIEGLEAMAELLRAQRPSVSGEPWAMGVTGLVSYRFKVAKKLRLQPVVFAEWTDQDTEFAGNDAARLVFGVNLLWKKSLRVMPQLELIRSISTVGDRNLFDDSTRFALIFSGQM